MSIRDGIRVVVGALLLAATSAASAADKLARLSLEVTVEGAKDWRNGEDYSNAKISEQYRIVTHVKSSGDPSSVNTKDPGFAQQQMGKAAQVQQKLREVQAKQGNAVPKQPATQQEYLAQQKKLAEDMQKGQAACKGDMNCLMQLAQKYSTQSAMLSPPPAPGAAVAPAVALTDADGEDFPEDERFLDYHGYEGCPTEIHIRVNNRSEGATADVSGMVPFKHSETADYRGSPHDLKMQCLASNLVYDFKARKIYTDGIGHAGPRGVYRYWDRLHGETVNKDSEIPTSGVAWDWVAKKLRIADASGSAQTTLPVDGKNAGAAPAGLAGDGSRVSGQIKVSMSWKFEPLK